jgi:hypothetical protein
MGHGKDTFYGSNFFNGNIKVRHFFWRCSLVFVFLGTLLISNSLHAAEAKRLALIIGNDKYQYISKLEKAGNDATAMAKELKSAGFDVELLKDANFRTMVRTIETFSRRINGGDQVVVFYAGHGVQIKSGNYLLPVDIEVGSESEIEKTAYSLDDLTAKLSDAKASFSLVMIDACRDNPLKTSGRSVGGNRGLASVEPPKGQMVVFSASRGQQALDKLHDNDNNPNGVFTREFIARMRTPGIKIQDLMSEVQDAVEKLAGSINHDQRPALYNESRGNFYFYQGVEPAAPAANASKSSVALDPETETWNAAVQSNSVTAYQAYLSAYPQGRYRAAASIKLETIERQAVTSQASQLSQVTRSQVLTSASATLTEPPVATVQSVVPTAKQASLAPLVDTELAFWNEVNNSGNIDFLDAYIQQYPKGKFIAPAKAELKRLQEQSKLRQVQEEALRQSIQSQNEQLAWNQAKQSQSINGFSEYLRSYPQGRYAPLAIISRQKIQQEELAKSRDASKELSPGINVKDCETCPDMIEIPAGSFMMGSQEFDSEQPVHPVQIKRFAMSKTEITRGQFAAFVDATGYVYGKSCWIWTGRDWRDSSDGSWLNPGFKQSNNDPAVCLNWDDVQAYIQWLQQKTGHTYRLPTEAEWEYAARSGSESAWSFGGDEAELVNHAWIRTNSGNRTQPVAQKPANRFGLHDMHGNVWEWTLDCATNNYNNAPPDGSAWNKNGCTQRVVRGGSWYSNPVNSRAAARNRFNANQRDSSYGFRLVREHSVRLANTATTP